MCLALLTTFQGGDAVNTFSNQFLTYIVSLRGDGTAKIDVTTSTSFGWIGFGVGTSMIGGDLTMMWLNGNGTISLSRRMATSYSQIHPVPDQSVVQLVPSSMNVYNGTISFSIIRPQILPESSLNANSTKYLWAYCSTRPASNQTSPIFMRHGNLGKFNLGLVNGEDPYDSLVLVHGVAMFASWGLAVPCAIFYASIGRRWSSWVNIHYGIQVFAVILNLVGFITGYLASAVHIVSDHQIIGVTMFIAFFLQFFLGWLIHRLYNPKRTHRPIRNHAHRVFGYAVEILALVEILLGFQDYNVSLELTYAYYAWLSVVGLVLFIGVATQVRAKVKEEMKLHS